MRIYLAFHVNWVRTTFDDAKTDEELAELAHLCATRNGRTTVRLVAGYSVHTGSGDTVLAAPTLRAARALCRSCPGPWFIARCHLTAAAACHWLVDDGTPCPPLTIEWWAHELGARQFFCTAPGEDDQ